MVVKVNEWIGAPEVCEPMFATLPFLFAHLIHVGTNTNDTPSNINAAA